MAGFIPQNYGKNIKEPDILGLNLDTIYVFSIWNNARYVSVP